MRNIEKFPDLYMWWPPFVTGWFVVNVAEKSKN